MEEEKSKLEDPATPYADRYTYGDYLKFDFDEMVELIRGKIFKMSPAPLSVHQKIVGNIHGFMWTYFKKASCQVFVAPYDVVLPIPNRKAGKSSDTVVQPDVCVICDPTKDQARGCFGAPDLVVEVISPDTSKKDIVHKHSVYEESLVKEYWVVYPRDEIVHVYKLEGKFFGRPMVYENKDLLSTELFPDLVLDLKEVFEVVDDDFDYGGRIV